MAKCCPTCGQEIPQNIRYGVRLPAKKLRIFDLIATRPGITQRELMDAVYGKQMDKSTVATHIIQINDKFADTDLRIEGKQYSGYKLRVPAGMKK